MAVVAATAALVMCASAWADPAKKKINTARILRVVEDFNGHVTLLKYGVRFLDYQWVMKEVQNIGGVKSAAPMVIMEAALVHGTKRRGTVLGF